MKTLISTIRAGRTGRPVEASPHDAVGQGMDLALTIGVFLVIGALIDNAVGVFPLFTIVGVVIAAVGSFLRMKYVYNETMERLEAERLAARAHRPERAR